MLKLTPRKITFLILTVFMVLILAQQYAVFLEGNYTHYFRKDKEHDAEAQLQDAIHRKATKWTAPLDWIQRLDYDLHLVRHNPGRRSQDIAVVEVNEKSISELGYFPFSRSVYRVLIERLEKAGAKVVAFDITFSERERNALDQLRKFREELIQKEGFDSQAARMLDSRIGEIDSDEDLQNALARTKMPVILGYSFANKEDSLKVTKEVSPEVLELLRDFQVKPLIKGVTRVDPEGRELPLVSSVTKLEGARPVVNLPELMRALNQRSSIGHFMPSADMDSVIRRAPILLEYKGMLLGFLALQAAAAYLGERPVYHLEDGQLSVRGVKQTEKGEEPGSLYVPLSPWGDVLARFYGGARTFQFTEFSDVVTGSKSDEELKVLFGGKIVFVGVTAVGLKDIRATPFSENYPGVEMHATVASNILQHNFMVQDFRFFWYGYLIMTIVGIVSAVAVYRFHPLASFIVTVLLIAIVQEGSRGLFFNKGVVVPTIMPSLCCFTIFFAGILYRYFTEEREKKMVRTAFGRYVSSAVVEEILKDQTKLRLGGQKKELTVMFVDLVNFTKISEHMDVGLVTQLLNEYFTRMTRILLANQGTLDKYMGDGIMCFWGAPLDIEGHAALACKTALEMQAELARINLEWKQKHGIEIGNRIGVHTGDMAVGNMGSDQVFSYTVMGDNVNLGSRLESVNTVYGTRIIVSAATAAKAGTAAYLFRPLDRVQVKGKDDAVEILELVSVKGEKEPEWVHAFRTGLAHYQAGEWDDAESAFGACLSLKPGDVPAQVFVERIRDFRIVQPDDWSGVWKFSQK